eukprot:8368672-Pyramimonas_sp.AAC.1
MLPKWFQGGSDKKGYVLEFPATARRKWGDIRGGASLGNACANEGKCGVDWLMGAHLTAGVDSD